MIDPLAGKPPAEIYRILLVRKAVGEETFDWTTITRDRLRQLYLDYDLLPVQIAELYGVTKSQVNSKRQSLGIYLSDKPPDADLHSELNAIFAAYKATVIAQALNSTAPFESRFKSPNGSRWHLALEDGHLSISRSVEGSREVEWTCDSPDDARSLVQQVGDRAVLEAAASAEEDAIISAPLEEREVAWLEGSLRTAIAVWD